MKQGALVGSIVPRGTFTADAEPDLFGFFGVDELRIIGAHERTVQLSEGSSLGCPIHDVTLKPDACSACRFLAGETA